ncbi:MAG TPA: hypothetical protein DD618_03995 [Acholeplasmatales bacterium]|nr:hypothetical protein [Acholeplasmatales bacterium]
MNELIERYIYDITRRLPEKTRAEVGKELRANINDMLPENPTDEAVEAVLIKLGEPRVLASGYRSKPRFLIAPEWKDEHLQVLKTVLIVFGTIALVSGLFDHLFNPEATHVIGIIFEVWWSVLYDVADSLLWAFAVVTIVFVGIQYSEKSGKIKEAWNPSKLPKENVVKINRSGNVVGLIMGLIFGSIWIFLLINNDVYLAWHDNLETMVLVAPLFSAAVVKPFIALFIISLVFSRLGTSSNFTSDIGIIGSRPYMRAKKSSQARWPSPF